MKSITEQYEAMVKNYDEDKLIVESVIGSEEVPFSDDEDDDIVDVDSISADTAKKINSAIDKIIDASPDEDDVEIEDLVDDDDDDLTELIED